MAYFECIIGGGGGGESDVNLIVTCSPNFAGKTITCTNGTDTFTQTCPSTSPYTVTFENIGKGTWTISGVISGQTFSQSVVIGDYTAQLNDVPEGSTVTPINDIQIWLHCANIWDKTYTTLNEVLADNTTLLALISSNNAVDYMVRSTDWAESVDFIPTMTSNTTPSGVVSATSVYDAGHAAWKTFDGDDTTTSLSANNASVPWYVQYAFASPISNPNHLRYVLAHQYSQACVGKIQLQKIDDSWVDVDSFSATYTTTNTVIDKAISGFTDSHKAIRLTLTSCPQVYGFGAKSLQVSKISPITTNQTAMGYIGNNDYAADTLLADATWREAICNSEYFESVLNVKVPTMTSNTAPSGTCSAKTVRTSGATEAWKAFDNSESTQYQSAQNTIGEYVAYKFARAAFKPILIIATETNVGGDNYDWFQGRFDASSSWEDIIGLKKGTLIKYILSTSNEYSEYRIYRKTQSANVMSIPIFQIYGRA